MSWLTIISIYLAFGCLLGEGLMYDDRKKGRKTRLHQYLIALLLGPALSLPIIIFQSFRRRRHK